eukprot:m.116492 g.116492  ORF g.116492 m.116492 type:complete len:448 (-) comp28510_c0_seq1:251-1594(-)
MSMVWRLLALACLLVATAGAKDQNKYAVVATEEADLTLSESVHDLQADSMATSSTDTKIEQPAYTGPEFVATNDWQQLEPGQPIPPGLHVSIDMQSGVKKAKLLDDEDQTGVKLPSEIRAENLEKISETLEELNDDAEQVVPLEERIEKYVQKLSEKKLQGIQVRRDPEIMLEIISSLQEPEVSEERMFDLLDELEGFAHQVDNALDLYSMGGFELINSYIANVNVSVVIRSVAAKVIGAACQNNPVAQQHAVNDGILPILLVQLDTSNDSTEIKRTLYAISAIIRHNPQARDLFWLELGGFGALLKLMHDSTLAVKSKAVGLVGDLVNEEIRGGRHAYEDPQVARESSAAPPKLLRSLADAGWCEVMLGFSSEIKENLLVHETNLISMLAMSPVCTEEFGNKKWVLQALERKSRETFDENPEENEFALDVSKLAREILDLQLILGG